MKPVLPLPPGTLPKAAFLITALAFSVFLLLSSPIGSPTSHAPASETRLAWAAFSFFPLILWAWAWVGPLWGLGTVTGAILLVGVVALASRQFALLWLPLEFGLFGWVIHQGIKRWQDAAQSSFLQAEHLQEDLNTLEDELNHLQGMRAGLLERLRRYQKLRQIANAFNASLHLDELKQRIVQSTGEVIGGADLVLLYLVDLQTLTLELGAVWRRSGTVTIKTKKGDPFDLWVMRHAQPLHIETPAQDFRFPQEALEKLGRPLGSLVAVPLVNEVRLMGVLRVESGIPRGLGAEDLRLTRIIGDLASLGIENSRLYHRMNELAITDDLTGLSVRAYFQKRLAEEIARARGLQMPVSLLLIDIDRFKVYNDTFGHTAGDKCLKQIAQILLKGRRPGEVVARFGGEEFVCLLPGMGAPEAARVAEEIRSEVERAQIELRRSLMQSTVSIGVASFPQDGGTPESLLQAVDERLYRAKASGRNRVCLV